MRWSLLVIVCIIVGCYGQHCTPDPYEPNDTPETAHTLTSLPVTLTLTVCNSTGVGAMNVTDDLDDFFRVNITTPGNSNSLSCIYKFRSIIHRIILERVICRCYTFLYGFSVPARADLDIYTFEDTLNFPALNYSFQSYRDGEYMAMNVQPGIFLIDNDVFRIDQPQLVLLYLHHCFLLSFVRSIFFSLELI